MKLNKKQAKVMVESLAAEYLALDIERQRIDREGRQLRKRLEELREGLQGIIGVAEELEVPCVARIGNYYITQIKKHRDVDSYSYDFIEFKVVDIQ
jgi:hypothetical protein